MVPRSLSSTAVATDVAEQIELRPIEGLPFARFDPRPDAELQDVAANHESLMERERALWEIAYRPAEPRNLAFVIDRVRAEPSPEVRWNLLWLLTKLNADEAVAALRSAREDPEIEVRDWARVLLEEQLHEPQGSEYTTASYSPDRTFDQTVPLEIAGFADVVLPNGDCVRAHLSPLWFNHIMGRVMAAVNVDTFMSDLVIEKELRAYNPDGSNHYETFLFRGFSMPVGPQSVQHIYESSGPRPFYRSGRVKDGTPSGNVHVTLARAAITDRITNEQITFTPASGDLDERGTRLGDFGAVRSVRGRFSGWAYVDLERFAASGAVDPGTVQLTSPADPEVGNLTNTLLHGSFRGKLADRTGDGVLDVNTVSCHATLAGDLDLDLDGLADEDPWISEQVAV